MRLLRTAFIGLLVTAAAGGAAADEATLGLDISSAYVWRGITMNDNAVLQPYSEFTVEMFSVSTWGNIDLDESDRIQHDGLFSEVDLTMSCVFSINAVDYKVGWIEYLYSDDSSDTREVYGTVNVFLFENVSADLEIYYDLDEVDDIYVRGRLGYIARLSDALDARVGASVAVAGEDMSAGDSGGFHDYSLSLDLVHGAESLCEFAVSVVHTGSMDKDVLPEQDVDFYVKGGVSIGF